MVWWPCGSVLIVECLVDTSIQVNIICLIWLQLVCLVISEGVPWLVLEVVFSIHQSFILLLSFSWWASCCGQSSGFLHGILHVMFWFCGNLYESPWYSHHGWLGIQNQLSVCLCDWHYNDSSKCSSLLVVCFCVCASWAVQSIIVTHHSVSVYSLCPYWFVCSVVMWSFKVISFLIFLMKTLRSAANMGL